MIAAVAAEGRPVRLEVSPVAEKEHWFPEVVDAVAVDGEYHLGNHALLVPGWSFAVRFVVEPGLELGPGPGPEPGQPHYFDEPSA